MQAEIFQHIRLVVRIAEGHVFHRNIKTFRRLRQKRAARVPAFRLFQHNIRQPFRVQAEHLDLHELVNQRADLALELRLVRHERHQCPHRKRAVQHRHCAPVHNQNICHAEEQAVGELEQHRQLLRGQPGIYRIHKEVHPGAMPLRTLFKQLHRLDAAHRLHEITALLRRMDDVFLRRAPQRVIRHPADGGIHQQHHQHHRRQLRTVQQHQRQREHRHQAVQHQHKKRRSQRALNTVHLAETRHHIAQMPLDEIRRRQIQQMAEHIGLPLHIERRR